MTAVPWCEDCDRMVDDEELTDEGECPECGADLATRRRIPWTFKLMIGATGVYVVWRIYQLVGWIVHHA